ncbi:MAG: immunoglobulin domain-containing protein [Verrucomicrobiota bacterium]
MTRYAVFYDGVMEFSTCGTMTITGPVYGNTNIYVGAGSGATLTFQSNVYCAGTISAPPNNGSNWGSPTNFFNGSGTVFKAGYNTNKYPLFPAISPNNPHMILDPPPATERVDSFLGWNRLCNRSQVVLLVSNATVSLRIRRNMPYQLPADDPAPVQLDCSTDPSELSGTLPFLTITHSFIDKREQKTNLVAQLDVGRYALWLSTNDSIAAKFPAGSTNYPTMLYVADNRTPLPGQMAVVRLTNGIAPPVNGGLGFSVATPNPMYVWGDYNCPNPAHRATTNTSATVPCALYSDALTLLSSNWTDTNSFTAYNTNLAAWKSASSDTVNALIVTGIVPSTGTTLTTFSGGVHNLPRLLENWSTRSLWLNTSLVCLYNSTRATNLFINPGAYYQPPLRNFYYDLNYTDTNRPAPPGSLLINPSTFLVVTNQPKDQVVGVGRNATFTVGADGDNGLIRYYWMFNGVFIDPNVSSSTLTITNATAANAGSYSALVVAGPGNLVSIRSAEATLSIAYPPKITVQPMSVTAAIGSRATFEVAASGTNPLYYYWQHGGTVSIGTNSQRRIDPVNSNDYGVYQVIVSNSWGSAASSRANLYPFVPRSALWVRSGSSSNNLNTASSASSVAADGIGNVVAGGHFSTRYLDFNGVVLSNPAPSTSASFIAKYDTNGYAMWAAVAGVPSDPSLRTASDPQGNSWLAGSFAGTCDFGGTVLTSGSPWDLFIAKYDPAGALQWVRQIGPVVDPADHITHSTGFGVDADGNAFVSRAFQGTLNVGGMALTNGAFLVKFDSSGAIAWARDAVVADTLGLGADGSIVAAGSWPGTLAKYDSDGEFLWSRDFPRGEAVALGRDGNIYVTGYGQAGTYDQFTLTNEVSMAPDLFVAKCDPSGTIVWLNQLGGTVEEHGSGIAVDAFDHIYVTGMSATGWPEPSLSFGTNSLRNAYAFLAKLDALGNWLWAFQPTGPAYFYSLCLAGNRAAFVGGAYRQAATLGQFSLTDSNANSWVSLLLAKMAVSDASNAPVILEESGDQTVLAGMNAGFHVTAAYSFPLLYQWFFKGTNFLAGAGGPDLSLDSVTMNQAGSYRVTVANDYDFTSSDDMTLTVLSSPAARLLAPALHGANQLQFDVAGVTGWQYAVEVSTNLMDWQPLSTNTSPFTFVQTNSPDRPQQFYRAVCQP